MTFHTEPACWDWPMLADHRIRAAAMGRSDFVEAVRLLEEWQDGRCAMCSCIPNDTTLVVDHDHYTAMVRGMLCQGCNVMEGKAGRGPTVFPRVVQYRQWHPAALLGFQVVYYDNYGPAQPLPPRPSQEELSAALDVLNAPRRRRPMDPETRAFLARVAADIAEEETS